MKLDVGEQIRERPAFDNGVDEKHQHVTSEMSTKQLSLDTAKKSDGATPTRWNIPRGGGEGEEREQDLEVLMSRMSLARRVTSQQQSPRVRALVRLVRVALSRADSGELRQLADTAELKSRPEFVRHLVELLDKDAERAKRDAPDGHGCQTTTPTTPGEVEPRDARQPKRRDLTVAALREGGDLCPRSPMRLQHHRSNNFPYQNTSRNHHSGGIMSAVAYSDAIGPTPQYHSHPLYQGLAAPASRPPLVGGSSDVPPALETTLDDLDGMGNLTEGDLQILMSLAVDLCPKYPTEYDMFPESISEINSTPFASKGADHRVPTDIIEELFPETWGGGGGGGDGGYYYHDDSTSGCSSLSPAGLGSPGGANPESPDSGRVVPDGVGAPNMSPPGQFFDDRLPDYGKTTTGGAGAGGGRFPPGDRSPGSSGYSSAGIPSPSDYPPAYDSARDDFDDARAHIDFDTRLQIASNDFYCGLGPDLEDLEFENVFEPAAYVPAPLPAPSASLGEVTPPIAEPASQSDAASLVRPAFASPTVAPVAFAPTYAGGGANHVRPATRPAVASPPVSNLKRLEPKVEHLLRVETGRERILALMDKKRKAEAWVNISLKIDEVAKQDRDGDTQLMILCANADRSGGGAPSYVLEYVYAMVETLRGIPRALSAVNRQRHSAVYLAALHGDYPHRAIVVRYIAETLIELGEELAHTTEGGDSMLHELCKQGDQRYDVLVELLSLRNQAGQPYFDVNQYNASGFTPLHVAVQSHGANNVTSLMTVQLLMAERADILLPDKTECQTALHMAISKSCAPRLVEALLRGAGQVAGRACNALNLGRDLPLHCAASRNDAPVAQQTRVIQLLLRHGAVKSLNAAGRFPIALVAEERRQEIRRVYETRKGNQANVAGLM